MLYMKTQQLNIRLPVKLLNDLAIVSNILKVNKTEWIKSKLSEEVHREKNKLLMNLSEQYSKGLITKKDVEIQVGKEIANEMELIKSKAMESINAGIKYGKYLKKRTIN